MKKNFSLSSKFNTSSPKQAVEVLEAAFGHLRIAQKVKDYEAFPHWADIVGSEIAAVTNPEKIIHGKVMVVNVADDAWAQELSMRKEEILDKIFASGLGAAISDIQFRIKGPIKGHSARFNKSSG